MEKAVVIFFSTALRCGYFLKKTSKKKPLRRHDKNYYYFCKSIIPVINLIAVSRNMMKVSKNMSSEKIRSTRRVAFMKYRQFLSVFYCFSFFTIFEKPTVSGKIVSFFNMSAKYNS